MTPGELKSQLERLKEDRAFLLLNAVVQEQVDALQNEILYTPCGSLDAAMKQEYAKGKLEGRLAWVALLETTIENCKIDIERLKETEDGNRNDSSDTGDLIRGGDSNAGLAP